jgi:hypothetical protein
MKRKVRHVQEKKKCLSVTPLKVKAKAQSNAVGATTVRLLLPASKSRKHHRDNKRTKDLLHADYQVGGEHERKNAESLRRNRSKWGGQCARAT